VAEHLVLRFEAPLQAWGDVAIDTRRPTRPFPSRSALAGLLANALGWRYRDADRTTALQNSLRYAVREDRPAEILRDYQTADLGAIGTKGWTRWGTESRGGASGGGTQLLEKFYLADGALTVAFKLIESGEAVHGVTLNDLEEALRLPARPLFLGRRGCPPATPLLPAAGSSRIRAETPLDALLEHPLARVDSERLAHQGSTYVRVWFDPADGTSVFLNGSEERGRRSEATEVWDRRDFRTNRFGGSRRIRQLLVPVSGLPHMSAEVAT
jgi:CRISPR system Cascade subunit CasD